MSKTLIGLNCVLKAELALLLCLKCEVVTCPIHKVKMPFCYLIVKCGTFLYPIQHNHWGCKFPLDKKCDVLRTYGGMSSLRNNMSPLEWSLFWIHCRTDAPSKELVLKAVCQGCYISNKFYTKRCKFIQIILLMHVSKVCERNANILIGDTPQAFECIICVAQVRNKIGVAEWLRKGPWFFSSPSLTDTFDAALMYVFFQLLQRSNVGMNKGQRISCVNFVKVA
ncbi:hypothetical protein POVCU2_0034390 [Plasmodium ovale curtisi]|uniref:Uncharacterized protein n=1 Tax=Plasmodium ovale curtisi TaxID=864141 RepID=A0A1A8VZM3_PLAOA|nr:hypothetical protein POVCU2_0034390 [Plasmodium ovale curtisi]